MKRSNLQKKAIRNLSKISNLVPLMLCPYQIIPAHLVTFFSCRPHRNKFLKTNVEKIPQKGRPFILNFQKKIDYLRQPQLLFISSGIRKGSMNFFLEIGGNIYVFVKRRVKRDASNRISRITLGTFQNINLIFENKIFWKVVVITTSVVRLPQKSSTMAQEIWISMIQDFLISISGLWLRTVIRINQFKWRGTRTWHFLSLFLILKIFLFNKIDLCFKIRKF